MLNTLYYAWTIWSMRTPVPESAICRYTQSMAQFCEAWTACAWEPTPWVHWMGCHSAAYLTLYKSLYVFSSIPSEYRHKGFKLDISHSCMAWKMTRPAYTQRSLAHVIRMHALDLILLRDMTSWSRETKKTVARSLVKLFCRWAVPCCSVMGIN